MEYLHKDSKTDVRVCVCITQCARGVTLTQVYKIISKNKHSLLLIT